MSGVGNGTFATQVAGTSATDDTNFAATGAFNKDGRPDLLLSFRQADSAIGVLLGQGDGTFQPLVLYPAVPGTYGAAVADFNGDGKLDIVAAGNADTHFALLTGNGNGTFNTAQLFETEFSGISIAAGDINKDGKADVVIANSFDSSVTYHPGNGNGTFGNRIWSQRLIPVQLRSRSPTLMRTRSSTSSPPTSSAMM